MAGVFENVKYGKRTINPRETIDDFFDTADKLYGAITYRIDGEISRIAKNKKTTFPNKESHKKWASEFKKGLSIEVKLLEDIAVWLWSLAIREGKVGKKTRKMLAGYGITDPKKLPTYAKNLGNSVLKAYEQMERQQLRKYRK
jgi:hypothetical protein